VREEEDEEEEQKARRAAGAAAPCGALLALLRLALDTKWAEAALPYGVQLYTSFPRKVLHEAGVISRELHRAAVSVQETPAPCDEKLFAVLPPDGPPPAAEDAPPQPEPKEELLLTGTQRAFELQRFLQAGYDLEEAAKRYAEGDLLPPTSPSKRPASRPATRNEGTSPQEREKRIEEVMNFTGVEEGTAERALQACNWITDLAVNHVLDSLTE